jgi:uncharacterized OB-fold protein
MHPAKYTRLNKQWKSFLGKTGQVVVSTYIRVAGSEHLRAAPYSLAIVAFGKNRKELMGVGHQRLEIGDKVRCVLRKGSKKNDSDPLEYQLKVKKVKQA